MEDTLEECECCGRRLGIPNLGTKYCYSDMELSFLGPGLPLFFVYIKVCILLLFMLSLVFCAYALGTNAVCADCIGNDHCSNSIMNRLSIVNKISQTTFLVIQNFFLLGTVICFVFLMQIFRLWFRKIEMQCDIRIDSPSDYAVMLSRLPRNTTQTDI